MLTLVSGYLFYKIGSI